MDIQQSRKELLDILQGESASGTLTREQSKKLRNANFMLIYGIPSGDILDSAHAPCTPEEASKMLDAYKGNYPDFFAALAGIVTKGDSE